jgi:predicted Zn-ribbon and HTH transcriptional regulator
MGDAAEMILEGIVCESCGVYIGEAIGYPRKCKDCKKEERRS